MFTLSTENVKSILEIKGFEKDPYIEVMLPIIIAMTEEYCNNTFSMRDEDGELMKNAAGYLLTNAAIALAVAKIIEYYMLKSGVQQNTISRVSYTFTTDLPKSILQLLNAHRKVKFV